MANPADSGKFFPRAIHCGWTHWLQGLLRALPTALSLLMAVGFGTPALATPAGGQVTSGQGSISRSGTTTTIDQKSQNLSLSWSGFDIAKSETVTFLQPGSSAIAVNRINGSSGSQILGHLNANGQVYLINPNGILFGKSAMVNVGGLVASTLDFADSDLLGTTRRFSGDGSGWVVNKGTISAADGGTVALLGHEVENDGTISAHLGSVALAAGKAMTLSFDGNRLVNLEITAGTLDDLAENDRLIVADGGRVLMSAGARDSLLASVVNDSGVIRAQTVENHDGTIVLGDGMQAGTVTVLGTLDASAPTGGDGGFIETSAAHVHIGDGAKVTTLAASGKNGLWLIDPDGFTIAPSRGDMSGAAVSSALSGGNFSILSTSGSGTDGNINVDDNISWSANTLTLSASNDIFINSPLTASGTAGLALEYGQGAASAGNTASYHIGAPVDLAATCSFSTRLGSDGSTVDYTIITSLGAEGSTTGSDLQGMNVDLAGHYALGSDIDASATRNWNGGQGFVPIGSNTGFFTGTLDGLGHTIDGLFINRPATDYQGLFGDTGSDATLRNLELTNVDITGQSEVSALAGVNDGTVDNCYATGIVNGYSSIGGLVGNNNGTVSNSYATGDVNGFYDIGGLVGDSGSGTVSNSYATGAVSGSLFVGGLMGDSGPGTVSNSYATGDVSGSQFIGGLLGNSGSGTVSNSYATGTVSGASHVGGLIGDKIIGTVSNSYWDTETSGQSASAGGTGKTTAEMQRLATFSGWDIDDAGGTGKTWRIYDGHTTPLLRGFLTPLTATANDAAKTYDRTAYSGGDGITWSAPSVVGSLSGSPSYGGSAQGAVNAGSYAIAPGGYWSDQQGYDIDDKDGTLTIAPAPLTISGLIANDKIYDGTSVAILTGTPTLGGVLAGDDVTLSGTVDTGTFSDKNIGADKTVTADLGSLTLSGADAGNYILIQPAGLSADIRQSPVGGIEATLLGGGTAPSIPPLQPQGSTNGSKPAAQSPTNPPTLASGAAALQGFSLAGLTVVDGGVRLPQDLVR